MKRLLASIVVLLAIVAGAPPAISAPHADVSLRLLGMAPWVTPDHTDIGLVATATNEGTIPADSLEFGLTVFSPSITRNEYEESLRRDPEGSNVKYARFPQVPGTLAPGETREIELSESVVQQ